MSFEEKLREQEKHIEEAAVDLFNHVHTGGPDDQMMPIFHIVDAKWRGHVVGTAFGTTPDKEAIARFIKQYCKEAGAILTVFATEVWYRTASPDEDDPLAVATSEHPDRKEALMLAFDSVLGHHMVCYPIIRDAAGARLGAREEWPGKAEGRFTGFVRTLDS